MLVIIIIMIIIIIIIIIIISIPKPRLSIYISENVVDLFSDRKSMCPNIGVILYCKLVLEFW